MSVITWNELLAPPSSQSHFAKFENFTPHDDNSFDQEFALLASSQKWIPGSQEYTRERTIAMREELKLHYFSSQQLALNNIDDDQHPQRNCHSCGRDLTEAAKLAGYQALCREVRIPTSDSVAECRRQLKRTLVNIVDLIDARRTGKEVKVWSSFEAFRAYTLQDELHRINAQEAKKDGGYLASLLQHFGGRGKRSRRKGGGGGSRIVSGRVNKQRGRA